MIPTPEATAAPAALAPAHLPAIDAPSGRPGDALLRGVLIPVWHIISELEELLGDRAAVAVEFGITDHHIEAACRYYHRNRPALDAAILANRRPDNL